ncbi:hypothetical protein HAZT_HAZT011130 [Hyalella azteca]|uniref:RNA helicase n=1 Tax=Hyalella azteca TaxID=294128 RepID=A0A6A0H6J1_HYAAZ|nr:hypothetical protein HAZT_HAZT011130 [Hyalella azteca]
MDALWECLSPPLLPAVAAGVKEFGFAKMTPVQAACIPRMLSYQDVAAEAVTGSGVAQTQQKSVVTVTRRWRKRV